jgi:ketosteroid isomerase-like protein
MTADAYRILAAVTLGLGLSEAGAQPADPHAADKAAIVEAETALANSPGIAVPEKFYAPDAVVVDLLYPGYYRGRKAIHDGFAPQFDGIKGIKVQFRELNVVTDGELACAFSLQQAELDMKQGAPMEVSLMATDVWRKIGGHWLVVQQHLSYPADPKTGMSVTNGPFPAHDPIDWHAEAASGPRSTSTSRSRATPRPARR